jgi:hypothetical protein
VKAGSLVGKSGKGMADFIGGAQGHFFAPTSSATNVIGYGFERGIQCD